MSEDDINALVEEKNRVVRENWRLRALLTSWDVDPDTGLHRTYPLDFKPAPVAPPEVR